MTATEFNAKLNELLDKAFNEYYDYITEKDIVKAAHEYSEKTAYKEAKASAIALFAEAMGFVIGEDEKSQHVRRFQCPNYGKSCYEWAEQWKMNSTPPYCSTDGRKMKSVEYNEPVGDEYNRNELRATQRETMRKLLNGGNDGN